MTSLDSASLSLAAALGAAALKSTVVLAVAGLLAHLLRRRTAALRHLIWIAALGSAVAVLLLPAALPAWRVLPLPRVSFIRTELPAPNTLGRIEGSEVVAPQQQDAAPPSLPDTRGDAARVAMRSDYSGPAQRGVPWAFLASSVWLFGVALIVARFAWSRIALERLARSSAESAESRALAEGLARRMGIARPVRLASSDDVELPLTWGIFRPQIVLPGDACEWSAECRQHVLEHEMAHVKRLDAATQMVTQAASALFWFHPLVWYAAERSRSERERACDDYVLANGAVPSHYAGDLLTLVTTRGHVQHHVVALAFAKRSHFERRLLALLDASTDRGTLSRARIAQVLGAAAAVVVPLAAVRPGNEPVGPVPAPVVAAAHETSLTPPAAAAAVPPLPVQPAVHAVPAPSVASPAAARAEDDLFAGCGAATMSHHSQDDVSNGIRNWTASGGNDACTFELSAQGDITFNSTATGVERLSPGSYIDVKTVLAGETAHLVVGASAAGEPTYQLVRNGRQSDGAAAAAWFEQFLIALDRTTAFAMNERLPALVAAGGAGAVLAEIDRMHSEYPKAQYLRRLADAAPLDVNALRHAGQIVAALRPGHESSEAVSAIARRYPLTDPTARRSFLTAALAIDTDHEQAQALLAILSNTPLTGAEADAVRAAAMRMRPRGEGPRILRALTGPGTGDTR